MSVVARRLMHWTEAEYCSMENESPVKHEYLAGEVFAMAGASPRHRNLRTGLVCGTWRIHSDGDVPC